MADTAEGPESMAVEGPGAAQGRRKRPRQRRKRRLGRQLSGVRGRRAVTASVRAMEVRREMFTHGQPVAPYNTTQFLIEDHGDLRDIDAQLSAAPLGSDAPPHRTRDSSFSIDSDDAFFYSSPEDEEEFLTKEFSLEYQDLHVERLNSLPKADIIRDYLLLENKYDKSVGELRKLKYESSRDMDTSTRAVKGDSGRDTDASSRSEADTGEQLRLALLENRRLKAELEKLRARRSSGSGSVDSESDSTCSSSMADVSNPSSPVSPMPAAFVEPGPPEAGAQGPSATTCPPVIATPPSASLDVLVED